MSKRIALLTAALLALVAVASFAQDLGTEKNPIIWAFVPSGDTAKITAGATQVSDLLNKSTGLFFKIFVATDYVGVIEALKSSPPKAHMTSLATAAYILAADQKLCSAALVSVRNGSAFYKGQIVARASAKIKTLADLKGRTFARVDPISASGWIVPSLILKAAGLDLDKDVKIVDAGTHPGVVNAVYSGQVDAGACFVDARANVRADKPDVMEKVLVLKESGNIPNDGVQFSPAIPPALKDTIVNGILDLLKTTEGKAAINVAYQWTGLEKHDDSFYDSFRQVLQAAGVTAEYMFPPRK